jgi:PAS domain S-box-containing protein
VRTWLFGGSFVGAWVRLFFLALLPLIVTLTALSLYQAKRIPWEVRHTSEVLINKDRVLVDETLLTHKRTAERLAAAAHRLSPAELSTVLLELDREDRSMLLGLAWLPRAGDPVVMSELASLWPGLASQIGPDGAPFRLLPAAGQTEPLLLLTVNRPEGQLLYLVKLGPLAKLLTPPNANDRWFALQDADGIEQMMQPSTRQVLQSKHVIRLTTEAAFAPGWSFVGYVDAYPAITNAWRGLLTSSLIVVICLAAGLGLALPAARRLLRPYWRLQEVAQLHLPALAAVSRMDQLEAAVALVNQLEDRLLSLEEQRRHFFSEVDVPFVILTLDGKVVETNRAWWRLIGYPPEYFKEHTISTTLHPDEVERARETFPDLLSQSTTVVSTWRHRAATGEDRWIAWSTTSDVQRRLIYGVARDVTPERLRERQTVLQAAAQQLWLAAKAGEGVQALLDQMLETLDQLFPGVRFAVWEEPANGRWLLRAGAPTVHPDTASLTFEITGELVRFGLLTVASEGAVSTEEESWLGTLVEMVGTAVKLEQESVHQMIQHGVNQLLLDAAGLPDLFARLLPLISRPMHGVAARLWAPGPGEQLSVLADWTEPSQPFGPEVFTMHQWIVQQTLADGHPRWIAEGTRLPHRPDEAMPVGRITFAVRVGARVVGCIDCLIPVLRTPEAGFLTLLDSVGAQIGLYMDRQQAEEERRQQVTLAAGRVDVKDLVAAGAPLETIIERVCLLAESLLPEAWTLSVFYDAEPDRPLILVGPSCPPDRLAQFHQFARQPGTYEAMRSRTDSYYCGTPPVIIEAMSNFGRSLVEMGVRSCWVLPVPIPPSKGLMRFGFYTAVPGGLLGRAQEVLTDVVQLAQMAVERWWLEEALNRRVDLLQEHMQEGLVAVDGEARLVQINPAARRILHLPPPASGRGSNGALPPPLTEAFRRALLPDAQPVPVTMKIDGNSVYGYISPVRSEEGALLGAIAILEDSAHRQRFQQLQTALVANVSHDLKAPLAALGALVETVADQQLPPEVQQQYLGLMRDEIARLRRLTQDLLLLARLDAGLLDIEPEELAMGDLLQGLAETWAPRCQAHGLTLRVTGAPVTAWADYDRVIQILTNLLDNAIKFTPAGGLIELGLAPVSGQRVSVFVRDTGSGIAPEHMEKLGSRFYMVDSARERTTATGTGLGLSIASSLAERMGGQVEIESQPGVGTTVRLCLPQAVTAG